jgi:hypothetical protein
MSAQSTVAAAISEGFERVEVDGTEYLAHDVVAQREGVYYYPDPEGGVQREYVPAEELHSAVEDVDEAPVLIRHPDAPEGTPKLTTNPRANFTEVGSWTDLEPTDDEKGIGGRVLIRINEIGEHDGVLRRYLKQVSQFGVGEVSTGYDIRMAESESGRHNGKAYDAVQRGIGLDHLALLPDEQGDCSAEDGCGLGRANECEQTLVRTNNHVPTDDASRQAAAGQMAEVFGVEQGRVNNVSYKSTSVSPDDVSFTDDEWDGSSAEDSFPNPSEDNDAPETLDQVYAAIPTDEDDRDAKSNWKLPFRTGPDAPVNTRALVAIEQAIEGARGGVEGLTVETADEIMSWVGRMLDEAPDDLFGADSEDRENLVKNIGKRVLGFIGSAGISVSTGSAESDRSNEPSNLMGDEDKVDTLVEEYGFTRENIAPLTGTTCLERIHEAVVEQEGEQETNMGDNPDDPGSGDGGSAFTEEQRERINEMVEEATPSAEEIADEIEVPSVESVDIDEDEIVEQAAEKAAEEAEQARAHEENVELIAQSDELPHIDRERAERMNEDLVEELVDDLEVDDEGSGEEDRANQAGRPVGSSFDAADFDTDGENEDIPAPGVQLGKSGGDD